MRYTCRMVLEWLFPDETAFGYGNLPSYEVVVAVTVSLSTLDGYVGTVVDSGHRWWSRGWRLQVSGRVMDYWIS